MFIRLTNSAGGYFDVTLGNDGQVLTSNGLSVAPSFQDPPAGALVHGFSYTQEWELAIITAGSRYDFGIGNFTAEFERGSAQSTGAHGPANYTTASDVPYAKRV